MADNINAYAFGIIFGTCVLPAKQISSSPKSLIFPAVKKKRKMMLQA
jgi:hypothetical protein